jgi:hypothetical protein
MGCFGMGIEGAVTLLSLRLADIAICARGVPVKLRAASGQRYARTSSDRISWLG